MSDLFKKTGEVHRFGGDIVVCPVCGNSDKFTENSIRIHVANRARAEVWHRELHLITETPHLDFYKKHTIQVRNKLVWTD